MNYAVREVGEGGNMGKDELEAAVILLATAVATFDRSSRGACVETEQMTKQAKETLSLKTWRPPAPVVQISRTVPVAERKEG